MNCDKQLVGTLSEEIEVNVAAAQAWELIGTLQLSKLVEAELSNLVQKIEVEGDGGAGTVLNLIFPPGTPVFTSYKEKLTVVDDKKKVKETEVVEGGYLDLGFTLYRVRFEVAEKGESSSSIRYTVEYKLKQEAAANASFASIQALSVIMRTAANHLIKNKK